MRPENLKTRIFLDGGDPRETREIMGLLGFLDGQTTNPTLIAKNPQARKMLADGQRFTEVELLNFYRLVVREISSLIPRGAISIEVYADASTTADTMLGQGEQMFGWIPNAHIKFPTNAPGLQAAAAAVRRGYRVNMTLCFSQEQAAAVSAATRGARRGDVFVSPFVGRLDERGENGMDLIQNILAMYRKGDSQVEVLTASVRTIDQMLQALHLGSDIVTAPFAILNAWAERGLPVPGSDYEYHASGLAPIHYRDLPLSSNWDQYQIAHDLTDKGMEKFSADWHSLIK